MEIDQFRQTEKKIRKYFRNHFGISQNSQGHSVELDLLLIDVNSAPSNLVRPVDWDHSVIDESHLFTQFKLNPLLSIHEIDGVLPGFYFISSAIPTSTQYILSKSALEQYSLAPHTNISNLIATGHIFSPDPGNWKKSIEDNDNFSRMSHLRWASLGYHYDWTSRMYRENLRSDFPEDLTILSRQLALLLGLEIQPEAAIVNYYPEGMSMSGHIDDAELDLTEPIISISLGCPAVFLMGGHSKSVPPVAILVRPGDVMVMSGPARTAYHGIAYVLPHSYLGRELNPPIEEESLGHVPPPSLCLDPVTSYLASHRINLNIRRVSPSQGEWTEKQGTGATTHTHIPPTTPTSTN